uniref:B3 domain-containing protein n=1 Tax=Noccaea caerulescens TaxID=107243 RepID=A0A1J3H0F4_NOCCA
MADSEPYPRFFKVFISCFCSDSLHIPISYYDQLPHPLPRSAILQGNGGCIWKVLMKEMQDEVHFTQGWSKFVEDNSLVDGDFMTFVYNGDCIFEVSVYDGRTACKVIRAVDTEAEDDKDDDIYTLSSSSSKDTDSASESETRANVILRSKNKGKSKVEDVEESDDEENSDDHLRSEDTDENFSESKMSKAITSSRDKGKKKVVEESDEGNDSDDEDYVEALGRLDVEESSNKSDTSYSPDTEDTASYMKNPKKKGKSKRREDVDSVSDSSEPKTKRGKVDPRIKDPESFLADPKNIHFETILKNRKHELLVHAQIVRDYELKFEPTIHYIDNHKDGKLQAKAIKWADQRVCIKKWKRICERNKVKEKDAILCELFRKRRTVYAVRIHIVREKDL